MFQWSYSNAGRFSSQSDPYYGPPSAATSATYDAYGEMSVYSGSYGHYNNFVYDFEGNPTTWSAGPGVDGPSHGDAQLQRLYDPIGQVKIEQFVYESQSPFRYVNALSVHGYMLSLLNVPGAGKGIVDLRTSAPIGVVTSDSQCPPGPVETYGYDPAGRKITDVTVLMKQHNPDPKLQRNPCPNKIVTTKSNSYDVENHLIGSSEQRSCTITCLGQATLHQPATYSWGPAGHPLKITGGGTFSTTIHWDGDTPLFTSTAAGVNDIKIEGLGYLNSGAGRIIAIDRDRYGLQIAEHDAAGFENWDIVLGYGAVYSWNQWEYHTGCFQNCSYKVPNVPGVGVGNGEGNAVPDFDGLIRMPRLDGITTPVAQIQGVRSYDLDMQAWTTPDVFAGEVHDPLSQKPYVWNRNDPYNYQDPSGYDPVDIENVGVGKLLASQKSFNERTLEFYKDKISSHTYAKLENALSKVGIGPHAVAGIEARSTDRNFSSAERKEVNALMAEHGCHTCGTTESGVKSGSAFIDHQVNSALNAAGKAQILLPQCQICSARQGPYVLWLVRFFRTF